MVRYYIRYHSETTIFWISSFLNSKDRVTFAMLFIPRKARGLQILCCRGIVVVYYSLTSAELSRCPLLTPPAKRDFTSDLLYEGVQWALKPSGFCNVKVRCNKTNERYNHDPQTFFKKIYDNITKYVDVKPYAQFIFIGRSPRR
jgi:hypothetical protein